MSPHGSGPTSSPAQDPDLTLLGVARYRRPVLSLRAAVTLLAIVDYVRRYSRVYSLCPRDLPSAASDVLDGWKWRTDPEILELVRQRVLRIVRVVGDGHTWHLTELGCRMVRGNFGMRSSGRALKQRDSARLLGAAGGSKP